MPSDFADSTITSDGEAQGGAPQPELALRWVFPDAAREPLWLDRTLTLGRDTSADIALPSAQISRRHAQLQVRGPLRLLEDLDSKNGVHVNARAVKSHVLEAGDVVRLGDFVAVVVAAPLNSDLSFRHFVAGIFGGLRHAQAVARLSAVARSQLPVVLEGETGTGKERFAAALHALSERAGPLVAVNCAIYNRTMGAAELFGYRRGAFTGAEQASPGHVRAASGGTLFLDEVLELPLEVQPMLLRALENQEVQAIGEVRVRKIDVRFVAASQVPLASAVERGHFRADLRARLEGQRVSLPALRHCREIIPELFCALYARHSEQRPSFNAGFVEALCLHDFSLNVRELDTLARRLALAPSSDRPLGVEALQDALGSEVRHSAPLAAAPATEAARAQSLIPGRRAGPYSEPELAALRAALERHGGNLTRAAGELGISRQRAYRMLQER